MTDRERFEAYFPSRNVWLGNRYDHPIDQARWEVWQKLQSAKTEALLKSEALLEYAEHKRSQARDAPPGAFRDRCNRMASNAEAYAARIREKGEVLGLVRKLRHSGTEGTNSLTDP